MPIDDALEDLNDESKYITHEIPEILDVIKNLPSLGARIRGDTPTFNESYLHWRKNLSGRQSNILGGSHRESIADNYEIKEAGEGSLQYTWAAKEYLHEGNKEKFKECLKKAAISRPNCVCSGGWMELIILAKNPEEAYRLALKDKDINLP